MIDCNAPYVLSEDSMVRDCVLFRHLYHLLCWRSVTEKQTACTLSLFSSVVSQKMMTDSAYFKTLWQLIGQRALPSIRERLLFLREWFGPYGCWRVCESMSHLLIVHVANPKCSCRQVVANLKMTSAFQRKYGTYMRT